MSVCWREGRLEELFILFNKLWIIRFCWESFSLHVSVVWRNSFKPSLITCPISSPVVDELSVVVWDDLVDVLGLLLLIIILPLRDSMRPFNVASYLEPNSFIFRLLYVLIKLFDNSWNASIWMLLWPSFYKFRLLIWFNCWKTICWYLGRNILEWTFFHSKFFINISLNKHKRY